MSSRSARELGGLLVLGVFALAARAAAPPAELTRGQKAKLAQRDRLVKSLPDLVQKRHHDKALSALERIAALEKDVQLAGRLLPRHENFPTSRRSTLGPVSHRHHARQHR
jgi:hypothetical protein